MAVTPHLSFSSAILLCHSYCWLLYLTGKKETKKRKKDTLVGVKCEQ